MVGDEVNVNKCAESVHTDNPTRAQLTLFNI